jgi:hypothetical protein
MTPTTIKNWFVEYGSSIHHVSSSDYDSAVKLSEDEGDDWYSLQTLGVQFEDCTICDNVLEVCRVQSVDQMLDQHVTMPEEEQ